jgi:hypothetical protein
MVLQTLLLRRNFPCPHFFGLGEGPESTQSGRSRGALRSAGFVPFADLQLIPWTGDLSEELSFPIDFFQIPAGFVLESQAGSTTLAR